MQQYKATLQPLHSKQRTGPKPQLPPRPSPLVLARTISAPPRQQNNSVLRRQGNVKKRQLQTQSALFPATFSISSSSPRQRPRHQSTSMADLDQRREFEVKGDVKQHQRETQSGFFPSTFSILPPSASPRRRLRRQSTSSVTDLDLRGKGTLTVRDRYRSEPGVGVDYTTTGHLRAARSSEWPMEPKSPRRPPRPPPILHLPKPNLGTAQKNTKPSSLGPGEAKSKPARPPPPLYKPRPPMPLPQSEGLLKRNSEQADDSDLTYCYVYERVQRNLERQVPEYESNCNSRAHSTSGESYTVYYSLISMHVNCIVIPFSILHNYVQWTLSYFLWCH